MTNMRTPGWSEVRIELTGELHSVQVGLIRGLNGKARTDKDSRMECRVDRGKDKTDKTPECTE